MDVIIDGRTWTLGDSIGSGGFGRVYVAASGDDEAVVKLVPKDPGAQRELLLANDLSGVPNVGGPLEQDLVLPILLDVAQALVSLEKNGVVHRDLKPDNILLLDGHWCLTDFGISRYAKATTAAETRKYFMTNQYAAPDQWRAGRATSATDVYAFGITAYELFTGGRPFSGPDFRGQHLHDTPPASRPPSATHCAASSTSAS